MHFNRNHACLNRAYVLLFFMLSCMVLSVAVSGPAMARGAPTIIRDDEIERTLRNWSTPIFKAAGLNPDSVNIILVQSPEINAFVTGGSNIFIYSGLLMRTDDPGEVLGVMGHETGHISGGHLIRSRDAMRNASYESMLGALIGIGAALATGDGSAMAAIGAGSSSMAHSRLMAFSRVQESSADQAALDYFERAGMNPEGLVSFMRKIQSEELLPASQQSEYMRTHPLTSSRIEALSAGLARSRYADRAWPAAWTEEHARIKAKLIGFISPERVAWEYNDRDQSVAARYARAIAAYRQHRSAEALSLMDGLLASEPSNPYFHELKGQMLFDFGRAAEALPYYRRAIDHQPDAALMRIAYGHALLESADRGSAGQVQEALTQLDRALKDEPRSVRLHRLLATAYGRLGQDGPAKVHLAEEAMLKGERDFARRQINAALRDLPEGSSHWLRAQDVLSSLDRG